MLNSTYILLSKRYAHNVVAPTEILSLELWSELSRSGYILVIYKDVVYNYCVEVINHSNIKLMKEVSIMEYKGTLIAVTDIEKAKQFYHSVLGLEVIMDAGVNVQLSGGVFLQTVDTWVNFIHRSVSDVAFENNAVELYFETDSMDGFIEKLEAFTNITYIHPVVEHSWGQRAVRFYDSDRHIIEVAENIVMVIKRFIDSGLTVEQTAKRMDVDVKYTKAALEQLG